MSKNRSSSAIIISFLLTVLVVYSFNGFSLFKYAKGLEWMSPLNSIQKYGYYVCCILMVSLIMVHALSGVTVWSRITWMIILFYGYLWIVRVFNGAGLYNKNILVCIIMVIACEIVLDRSYVAIFRYFINTANLLIIMNFITVVISRTNGGFYYYNAEYNRYMYTGQYLLGYDNGHIVFILPIVCFDLILFIHYKKKYHLIMVIIGSLNCYLVFSATSIVATVLFWLLFVLLFLRKMRKLYNPIFWTTIFFGAYLVFFQFEGYRTLSNLLIIFFSKSIETVRMGMYSISMDYINRARLFGYGYQYSTTWIAGYPGPHNIVMQLLLYGGIVGLVWFMWIIFDTIKNARNFMEFGEVAVLLSGIIAFLFADFAEGYENYITFYLFWFMCITLCRMEDFRILIEGYYDNILEVQFHH